MASLALGNGLQRRKAGGMIGHYLQYQGNPLVSCAEGCGTMQILFFMQD